MQSRKKMGCGSEVPGFWLQVGEDQTLSSSSFLSSWSGAKWKSARRAIWGKRLENNSFILNRNMKNRKVFEIEQNFFRWDIHLSSKENISVLYTLGHTDSDDVVLFPEEPTHKQEQFNKNVRESAEVEARSYLKRSGGLLGGGGAGGYRS